MKNEWVTRIIRILCFFLLALVVSTMLVSCDAVTTALQAIGRFFIFVLWLLLAITGLVVWIVFTINYFNDENRNEKWLEMSKQPPSEKWLRKNKSPPEPTAWLWLYFGFLASCVCIFSLTRLLGGVPAWLLGIGALGHAFILFMLLREGLGVKNLPYVWLVSAGILGALSYIFGLMSRTFEFQAFTITTNPIYCIAASGVLALIPAFLVFKVNKLKEEEKRRRTEEEERVRREREAEERRRIAVIMAVIDYHAAEEKRRLEEIERNKPIAVKLAELEDEAQEQRYEDGEKLKQAELEFSQLQVHHGKSPYDLYLDSKKDLSGGLGERRQRYAELLEIAQYYHAWYQVQMSNAELEKKRYNYCRKKAVLFDQRLEDIYIKLTENQKERKIADVATDFNIDINEINKWIGQEKFDVTPIQFSGEGLEALSTNFGDLWEKLIFLGSSSIPNRGEVAIVLTGIAALETLGSFAREGFEAIKDAIESYQYKKIRIEMAVNELHETIRKINESHLKATAFCKRAGEFNMALEKAMNGYEDEFLKVYNMLYPAGDASRSKEARTLNKLNGGFYFCDEEVYPVLRLRVLGKFLVNIVYTEF